MEVFKPCAPAAEDPEVVMLLVEPIVDRVSVAPGPEATVIELFIGRAPAAADTRRRLNLELVQGRRPAGLVGLGGEELFKGGIAVVAMEGLDCCETGTGCYL